MICRKKTGRAAPALTSFAAALRYNGGEGQGGCAVVYVVWADVLWLVNFVMDWLLLWAAARLGGFITRRRRLVVGAVLGAFYGVGVLWPVLAPLYTLPGAVICSCLMLWVAFGRLPLRRFAVLVGCFYMLSFAMCGAVLGLRALLGLGWGTVSVRWLLLAAVSAGVLAGIGVAAWRRMLRSCGMLAEARVEFAGRSVRLNCFLDTGNNLREPLSGRPVLLAELAALQQVLPEELCRRLSELYRVQGMKCRPYQLLVDLAGYDWGNRLVLLPFCSVGEQGGLLLGFIPDMVELQTAGDERPRQTELVLALCPLPLKGLQGARGIVHPDVVWAAMGDAGVQAA